jgi:hypothetical protein
MKNEIFTREELDKVLPDIAQRTIDHYAQQLIREGKIDKIKFNRKTYYGNKEIIKKIKDKKMENAGTPLDVESESELEPEPKPETSENSEMVKVKKEKK